MPIIIIIIIFFFNRLLLLLLLLSSGLPRTKHSASQSTGKSVRQQNSKESLHSVHFSLPEQSREREREHAREGTSSLGRHGDGAGEGPGRSELPGQQLGHLVTVGLGGVCGQVRLWGSFFLILIFLYYKCFFCWYFWLFGFVF